MSNLKNEANDWAARSANNAALVAWWSAAWVATTALAAFGPKLIWNFHTLLTILAVLINLGVGVAWIVACKRCLKVMDELHQKIVLDAAVLSLGVGFVCGGSYELLEDVRLIPFQPEVSHLTILMGLTFLAGMIAGLKKYQ